MQLELRDKNGLTEAEFLAQYKQKDYPRPSFTADVVVFSGASSAVESFARDGACAMRVLLIKRGGHPYLGCWAFPGGFVNPTEDADTAAARELEEETGAAGLFAEQLGIYSAPGRDPRGWTVSAAYLACTEEDIAACAGDDAAQASWCSVQIEHREDGLVAATVEADGDELVCVFACRDEGSAVARAKVVSSEGFAFDHANIFADALAKLIA